MKKFSPLLLVLFCMPLVAQDFNAYLELRPRFEARNGYKTLLNTNQEATEFISQRSRLQLGYKDEDLQVKFSLQNVRVWGDVPTNATEDKNGVAVFEAYGQYRVNPFISIRLGRQMLVYDNQRIFGAGNWLQQARSHDALLLFVIPKPNQQLHAGFALSAPGEELFNTAYTVDNYKNLQFAWYNWKFASSGLSLLFLNTGYEYESSTGTRETQYSQTFGSFYTFHKRNFGGNLAAYGQTGERNNNNVEAFYAGGNVDFKITNNWAVGAGVDFSSGTGMMSSGDNHSFSPLFGANHAHNGYMDYFFAGNHFNSVGLLDTYGKVAFGFQKTDFAVIPHVFYSAAEIVNTNNEEMDSYLGTEVDLVGAYKIRKDLSLGLGYSHMFGSESLEVLKGGDSGRIQNWTWLMVSFNPELFSYKKPETPITIN